MSYLLDLLKFICILSVLVIFHEFGHFWAARKLGVRVEEFSLGFGRKLLSFKKNHTEYSICLVLFGGFVKMAGDNYKEHKGKSYEYLSRPVWQRITIVFFGPLLNYILAFLCFWFVFIFEPPLKPKVGGLLDNYPAKEAGVLVSDTILSIDGAAIKSWQQMQRIIFLEKKESIKLKLKRNDEILELSVPIKKEEIEIEGLSETKQKVNLIGITPAGEHYNFISSFPLAAQNLFFLTTFTYETFWRMLTGQLSLRESVTGPIGIFKITQDISRFGFLAVIDLMAILSLSLAIFNLLPFPIMDGGHIVILLLEKLRKKRISQKIDGIITQIGTSLIIFFALAISYNDFVKYGYLEKVLGWLAALIKR